MAKMKTTSKSGNGSKSATTRKRQTTLSGTGSSKGVATMGAMAVSQEMIAERAYQIWQERGRPVGLDVENWVQAERELKN